MATVPDMLRWYRFAYDGSAGCRLDTFLRERYRPFSRTAWSRRVRLGLVLVNGRPAAGSRRMRAGDLLEIDPAAVGPPPPLGGIRLLFEDDHLVAIAKESGILVHPVRLMTRDTVVGFLRERLPQIRPCHRLDKLTSGLVLLAKHAESARAVHRAFEAGKVLKRYVALVEGRVEELAGVFDWPIGPDVDSPVHIKRAVCEDGEPCATEFTRLELLGTHTLLEVRPRTGRKHQIRVHLAHAGRPIDGDFLYGRQMDVDYFENREVNLTRDSERWIALHASRLELDHPMRPGERLCLEAPLPERFQRRLAGLRDLAQGPA